MTMSNPTGEDMNECDALEMRMTHPFKKKKKLEGKRTRCQPKHMKHGKTFRQSNKLNISIFLFYLLCQHTFM